MWDNLTLRILCLGNRYSPCPTFSSYCLTGKNIWLEERWPKQNFRAAFPFSTIWSTRHRRLLSLSLTHTHPQQDMLSDCSRLARPSPSNQVLLITSCLTVLARGSNTMPRSCAGQSSVLWEQVRNTDLVPTARVHVLPFSFPLVHLDMGCLCQSQFSMSPFPGSALALNPACFC